MLADDGIAIEYARESVEFYSAVSGKRLALSRSDWQPIGRIMPNGEYVRANVTKFAQLKADLSAYDEKTDDTIRASGPPGSKARIDALAAFYARAAAEGRERSPFVDLSAERLADVLAANLRDEARIARRIRAERQTGDSLDE